MKKIIIYFSVLFISADLHSQKSFKVEVQGSGQPVLVFPGFASTPEAFTEITDELSKKYEVHAFTFAGFGGVKPIAFPWLPAIKEDILHYIQTNNLQKPVLLGHSMGGTLGLWLAAESNQFSQLILIDALPAIGALMYPDYESSTIGYDTPYNTQLLHMDAENFQKVAEQMAAGMCNDIEKQRQIISWILESDRKTYVYGYTDLLRLDVRPELKKINIPVTLFAATEPYGKERVTATYKHQYENLKNYTLIFAEGAGHYIMYDKPAWLLQQIKTVLTRNE